MRKPTWILRENEQDDAETLVCHLFEVTSCLLRQVLESKQNVRFVTSPQTNEDDRKKSTSSWERTSQIKIESIKNLQSISFERQRSNTKMIARDPWDMTMPRIPESIPCCSVFGSKFRFLLNLHLNLIICFLFRRKWHFYALTVWCRWHSDRSNEVKAVSQRNENEEESS